MAASLQAYKLIAICGLANSGKDTASNMLSYILNAPKIFRTYRWYKLLKKWPFNKKYEITAFAKPLKQTLSIILNRPLNWFNNRENKENYYIDLNTLKVYHKNMISETLRCSENKFQRYIKNDEPLPSSLYISTRQLMQYYGTECIRKYLGDKTWINATLNKTSTKRIIVSDLRFKIELDEIKKRNGVSVYISRLSSKPGTHASEREVLELFADNKFDYIVHNDRSLEDLFNNLKAIV